MSTLIIKGLKKTYSNGTQALKGVDLTINTGMYGLLGPNGAGKSTLMRTIATLQEADEGSIFLDDLNVLEEKHRVRQILGFLPQEFDVYPKVSAYELLDHLAILKGMTDRKKRKEAINIILEKTNLVQYGKKYLGGYSGGMKQRFGIAQALLNNPALLIVDEPTAGLDPEERNRFLNILGELGENIIVILSTHIVDDVTELCNSMAIINEGEVLIENHPEFVISQMKDKMYRKIVEKIDFKDKIENDSRYNVLSSKMYLGKTMVNIYSEENPGDDFTPYQPDLEDAYFYFIKKHNSISCHVEERNISGDSSQAQNDKVSAQNDKVSAQNDKVSAQNDKVSAQNDNVSAQNDKPCHVEERNISGDSSQAQNDKAVAQNDNVSAQNDKEVDGDKKADGGE